MVHQYKDCVPGGVGQVRRCSGKACAQEPCMGPRVMVQITDQLFQLIFHNLTKKKKKSQEKNEQKAQITNSTLLVGKLRLTEIRGFLCKCTVIKWQQSKIFWSQCSVLLATACRLSF